MTDRSPVIDLHINQFLEQNNIQLSKTQKEAMQSILNQTPVLRMYGKSCGKTFLFKLIEKFLNERGGDVLRDSIIESGIYWSRPADKGS